MDFSQCRFQDSLKTACGSSLGCSESLKVIECDDNIEKHQESFNLWRTSGLKEIDFIIARVRHFQLSKNQIESMNICPRHRHNLRKFCCPPGTCRYLLHFLNVAMERDIQAVLKNTVGMCRKSIYLHRFSNS